MEQQIYIIRVKEKGNPDWIESYYAGNRTKEQLIEFYGLNQPDVEAYQIQVQGTPLVYGRMHGAGR
jgi:hypothetical protein